MPHPYIQTLLALRNSGLEFAAIGTFALKLYFPAQLADYTLKDCDLVMPWNMEQIKLAVATLENLGWKCSVWEEDLPKELSEEWLEGKFYLRARQEAYIIDLTYEPVIAWEEMAMGITLKNHVPCASLEHVLALKRIKGQPSDLEMVQKIEAWAGLG
jgi:hypothetical protein